LKFFNLSTEKNHLYFQTTFKITGFAGLWMMLLHPAAPAICSPVPEGVSDSG
jgi:hypothetical protein